MRIGSKHSTRISITKYKNPISHHSISIYLPINTMFMFPSAQQINPTKNIKQPNPYIQALYNEYKDWAFNEASAIQKKGQWRKLFLKKHSTPLHLEIGPGNGKHFAKLCLNQPKASFLSIELKYKALMQTIRRVRKNDCLNGRVIRYNARRIGDLFKKQELNNVYIHFPDPWLKKRRYQKHQLIQEDFCKTLSLLQKPNSFLEFKTDSEDYFHQSIQWFKTAGYQLCQCHLNLYKNQKQIKGFMNGLSQFELLFFQKEVPIKYALFLKH